jgi:peptide-methionine (R)-S-oxide reductase
MTRRRFLRRSFVLGGLWALIPGCARSERAVSNTAPDPEVGRLLKPADEWKRILGDERYAVLFEHDTEPPFTSPLNDEKRRGTFVCAACYLPLFSSEAKFDSGTGWPSFTRSIPGRVGLQDDYALLIRRTEYHCIRCGGHQGHVFDDGPPPTGQRWCNNGLALEFVPADAPLPPLRT